jgi:hypothetical protein
LIKYQIAYPKCKKSNFNMGYYIVQKSRLFFKIMALFLKNKGEESAGQDEGEAPWNVSRILQKNEEKSPIQKKPVTCRLFSNQPAYQKLFRVLAICHMLRLPRQFFQVHRGSHP